MTFFEMFDAAKAGFANADVSGSEWSRCHSD